jgi:hypothetical protein
MEVYSDLPTARARLPLQGRCHVMYIVYGKLYPIDSWAFVLWWWHQRPISTGDVNKRGKPHDHSNARSAIVLGGGLANMLVACELALRDLGVTLERFRRWGGMPIPIYRMGHRWNIGIPM